MMRLLCVLFILRKVCAIDTVPSDLVQVKVDSGVLQGNVKYLSDARPYYNFQGIPYAVPPLGSLRFKDPVPFKKWKGILDATQFRPTCVEIALRQISYSVYGQEDCLYLNVYASKNPHSSDKALPVMVWIYGGSFREGSSTFYGPEYLMREDVVVVTFNYRLGVFGFLSTQDHHAPGNYGIKDIILTLKWVKRNIANFGGDPNNVTVFGESAGAALVGYLLLSPQSENLFHAVIMASGTPLCFWALHRNARKVAFDLGVSLGLTTNSSSKLVDYLRSADLPRHGSDMIAVNLLNFPEVFDNGGPFGPVVEPESNAAVLTQDSYKAFKNGHFYKVPVLIGLNSQESKFFNSLLPLSRPIFFLYDISPSFLVRTTMNVKSVRDKRIVGTKIIAQYFKDRSVMTGSDAELADYFSDDLFVRPITKTAQFLAKYVPVYFYVFDFEGNMGKKWLNFAAQENSQVKGVGHGTELWYLWKGYWTNQSLVTREEIATSTRMVKLWTNFAKYSNPTPTRDDTFDNVQWPLVKGRDVPYFRIGKNVSIGNNFKEKNMRFWDNLYRIYSKGAFQVY